MAPPTLEKGRNLCNEKMKEKKIEKEQERERERSSCQNSETDGGNKLSKTCNKTKINQGGGLLRCGKLQLLHF